MGKPHKQSCAMQVKSLLALAPHTDDVELGCGGTLARFLETDTEIRVAAFSTADDALPDGIAPGSLETEFLEAMDILGLPRDNLLVYDYPVRRLSYHRQDVLDELIRLRDSIKPDIVFVTSASDVHQDHQVLHAEALRAFREVSIWGYELPWNHTTFATHAFVTLEKRHLEKKWKALKAYKSQLVQERPYFSWDFVEALARIRGVQVKAEFAEAFEVCRVRW